MSDLQCAVRVFLAPGNVPAPSLLGLRAERIALVLAPTGPDGATAKAAGAALSSRVEHRPDLHGVDGVVAVLHDLADTHRGEAVLVVLGQELVPDVVARLGASGSRTPGNAEGGIALVEGDADGWVATRWTGEPTG